MQTFQASDTLSVEIGKEGETRFLRVVRKDGGLIQVELSEVRDLVAGLSEMAARAAAEQAGQDYVESDDLW